MNYFNRGDLIILQEDLAFNPKKVNLAPVWLLSEPGLNGHTLINMSTNEQVIGSTHKFYHAKDKIDEIIANIENHLERLKCLRELANR